MGEIRPSIPVRLAERPTVAGLVQPWVNVQLADGGVDFRQTYGTHRSRAWLEQRCQVDGEPITGLMVFLGGPNQIAGGGYFDEPPLHPECAAYVTKACPMVAGRMTHYRANASITESARGAVCPDPGCDCGGWVATDHTLRDDGSIAVALVDRAEPRGDPAHVWYAVYARSYALAKTPEGVLLGGVPLDVLRIRKVSHPGPEVADG